jgi:putative nucleotidyltransferase with HDIG domain
MQRRLPQRLVSRAAAALFALVIAGALVVLVVPVFRFEDGLQEGDVASRTFTAVHDAPPFESPALTEAARAEAAAQVPESPLPVDPAIRQQQVDRATRFLDQVRNILARSDLSAQEKQDAIGRLTTPQPLTNRERGALVSFTAPQITELSVKAKFGLEDILSLPLKSADIVQAVDEHLDAAPFPATTEEEVIALTAVLRVFSVETFVVDQATTSARREEARRAVVPVFRNFAAGQVIVTEGQEITAQDIEAFKATGVIEDGIDPFAVAGGVIISVGVAILLGGYAFLFQPFPQPANRRLVLVAVSFAAVLVGARIVLPLVTPDASSHYYAFALPIATAATVAACFGELSFAVLVALVAGLMAAFIGGTSPQIAGSSYIGSLQSLELGMTYVAAGLAGAAAVYRASRLGRFALAAVAVAAATGIVMVVFWLISAQRENVDLAWIALAAGVHGLASAVLAVGAFVVLSLLFGVTTRLQLMELAQAEHPLLRRLQDEAPGTYHHSMLVGALAERAAVQVGADPLLVRIGAYYHDIGKLAMPGHYVENMLDGTPSPHDSMTPVESARIIRAHVTNGIDLAKKYRLPGIVRDFIPQHHGTRLVTFFYRKAAAAGDPVPAADYRYEGPRPQTREAAIVMLADSSEAVARSRQDEGAPSIDQVVDSVFAERLAEGQLDDCDITLRDLQVVAASFKATLRAVYHPRVQYPSPTPEEIATLARGETPAVGH